MKKNLKALSSLLLRQGGQRGAIYNIITFAPQEPPVADTKKLNKFHQYYIKINKTIVFTYNLSKNPKTTKNFFSHFAKI